VALTKAYADGQLRPGRDAGSRAPLNQLDARWRESVLDKTSQAWQYAFTALLIILG